MKNQHLIYAGRMTEHSFIDDSLALLVCNIDDLLEKLDEDIDFAEEKGLTKAVEVLAECRNKLNSARIDIQVHDARAKLVSSRMEKMLDNCE